MKAPGTRHYLAMIALVALLLPAAPGFAQDPGVYPDLTITDFGIVSGTIPEWIDGKVHPTILDVQATVYNRGGSPSAGFRIDYYWVDAQGAHWLNGEEKNSFDVYDGGEIPAKTSRDQPPMPWTIQPHQKGAGALRAELTPLGYDRYSSNDAFQTATFTIPVHEIQLTIPGPGYGLHNPQDTRFVQVTAHNAGNVPETIDLGIQGETIQPIDRHADVTPFLQYTTMELEPGETKESSLFVDYEFSGDDGEFTVSYTIQATTSYQRTLEATTPTFTGVGGNEPPPDGSPVELVRADDDPLVIPQAGAVTRWFLVTNTGTVSDSYRVHPVVEPGWAAEVGLEGLEDASSARLALEPAEERLVRMTLYPPHDAVAGQPTDAGLRAETDHLGDSVQRIWSFRVDGPAVRIESDPQWDPSPYQGDPVRAMLVVHNDGTRPTTEGAKMRLQATGGDVLDILDDVNVVIPAGQSMQMAVESESLFTGEGPVAFTVEWVEGGDPIHKTPLNVVGFIRAPAVTIHAAEGLPGAPGETVRYRIGDHAFKVTNEGNARETFHIEARTDGGTVERITEGPITLDPRQQQTIPLDHALPIPTGPTDHLNVSLKASIAGRPDLNWTANTTTSIFDQSAPDIDADGLPVEWALGGNLSISAVVSDDSAVHSVNATHRAPDGTESVHALLPVGDGEEDEWAVEIHLDQVGGHAFFLFAKDIHGNNATVTLDVVQVRPIPGPNVSLDGPAGASIVAPNTTYQVNVSDERPIAIVKVLFHDKDGKPVWERELDADSDLLRFNLSEAPNGPITITVQAINDAGAHSTVVLQVIMQGQPMGEEAVANDDLADSEEKKSTPFPATGGLLIPLLAWLRRCAAKRKPASAGKIHGGRP